MGLKVKTRLKNLCKLFVQDHNVSSPALILEQYSRVFSLAFLNIFSEKNKKIQ